MERYYRIAGVDLGIRIPESYMYADERQLAPFRVQEVKDPHWFDFSLVDALDAPEGAEVVALPSLREYRHKDKTLRYIGHVENSWEEAYIRTERNGNHHRVQLLARQFPNTIGVKTVLNSIEAEHLVLEKNGVVFHSAFIEWEGKGILFTAPSGTGKSTQADLWHSLRDAKIINGDRSAIRCCEDGIYAEGIPFSGSSQYCEKGRLPLAAIVYLGQAPSTSISRFQGVQAFRRIWEGISVNTWDKDDVQTASDLVQIIAQKIPVYHLPCTPDESAVIALEQMLRKQECV